MIDLKIPYNLEMITDKNFAVTNLNLNGNKFKIGAHKQLAHLFALAGPLQVLTMRACILENEGLITTFETLKDQRRLKQIDYSNNGIFDRGIDGICPFIADKHFKSHIEVLKFNQNDITDHGFKKLISTIEMQPNAISELGFIDNDLTDDSAFFFYNWLKKHRMRDVRHSMNIVQCDF